MDLAPRSFELGIPGSIRLDLFYIGGGHTPTALNQRRPSGSMSSNKNLPRRPKPARPSSALSTSLDMQADIVVMVARPVAGICNRLRTLLHSILGPRAPSQPLRYSPTARNSQFEGPRRKNCHPTSVSSYPSYKIL